MLKKTAQTDHMHTVNLVNLAQCTYDSAMIVRERLLNTEHLGYELYDLEDTALAFLCAAKRLSQKYP